MDLGFPHPDKQRGARPRDRAAYHALMALTVLPEFDRDACPQAFNLGACAAWLAGLTALRAADRCAALTGELDQLNRYPMSPLDRLEVLEVLRETVEDAQRRHEEAYRGHPMPFGTEEAAAWHRTERLWEALLAGYQRCLSAAHDVRVRPYLALLTQRCLRYARLLMLHQFHAYRPLQERHWRLLDALYAFAEAEGFATARVADALDVFDGASTCAATYVHALLFFFANPYRFNARAADAVNAWLDKWAGRVPVRAQPPAISGLATLAVDLATSTVVFVGPDTPPLEAPRYLHTHRLADGLRKRIEYLRGGGEPDELDLDVGGGHASLTLLVTLYQHWCEVVQARCCPRQEAGGFAEVACGFPGAHALVGGGAPGTRPARNPNPISTLRRWRRPGTPTAAPAAERWRLRDTSSQGFGVTRDAQLAHRVCCGGLMAVSVGEGHAALATACWLRAEDGRDLYCGARALPGRPRAVRVAARWREGWVAAFLMAPAEPWECPPSLVLPKGWYRPGLYVQVDLRELTVVRLTRLLEEGEDFERVAFMVRRRAWPGRAAALQGAPLRG